VCSPLSACLAPFLHTYRGPRESKSAAPIRSGSPCEQGAGWAVPFIPEVGSCCAGAAHTCFLATATACVTCTAASSSSSTQGTAPKLLLLLPAAACSFVKELQALRRKLEAGHDAAADFSLVSLVRALRDNAGAIKEGAHDAVLTTVLSISLWACSSVSVCGCLVHAACHPSTKAFLHVQSLACRQLQSRCMLPGQCSDPCTCSAAGLTPADSNTHTHTHTLCACSLTAGFACCLPVLLSCRHAECAGCCAGPCSGADCHQQHVHWQLPAGACSCRTRGVQHRSSSYHKAAVASKQSVYSRCDDQTVFLTEVIGKLGTPAAPAVLAQSRRGSSITSSTGLQ
jgi:hypothetical protein